MLFCHRKLTFVQKIQKRLIIINTVNCCIAVTSLKVPTMHWKIQLFAIKQFEYKI